MRFRKISTVAKHTQPVCVPDEARFLESEDSQTAHMASIDEVLTFTLGADQIFEPSAVFLRQTP